MNPQKQQCVIFDLDGTLADCRHRLHHIKNGNKNWAAFFNEMGKDTAIGYVVKLLDLIHLADDSESDDYNLSIILCSGRPDSHRAQTEKWLHEMVIYHDLLLMRKTGDFRPDTAVKFEMLKKLREAGYDVLFAVDDRPDIVKMWRENGVPCFAVEDHNWR